MKKHNKFNYSDNDIEFLNRTNKNNQNSMKSLNSLNSQNSLKSINSQKSYSLNNHKNSNSHNSHNSHNSQKIMNKKGNTYDNKSRSIEQLNRNSNIITPKRKMIDDESGDTKDILYYLSFYDKEWWQLI